MSERAQVGDRWSADGQRGQVAQPGQRAQVGDRCIHDGQRGQVAQPRERAQVGDGCSADGQRGQVAQPGQRARGTFLCAQAVLPGMIQRRRGRIINVASGAGLGVMVNGSAYVTSKAAVIRFSENLAAEASAYDIAVFSIGPGLVRTAMTEYLAYSQEGRKWPPWGQEFMEAGNDVPPERAGERVVMLAAGRADALSGRFIGIADDIDALVRRAEEIKRDDLYLMRLRT